MRTWIRLGSIQDRFNFFIESKSFAELKGEFMNMFFRQIFKFKVNYSFGFILKHIKSGEYRYFHASQNMDRWLDHSKLISDRNEFEIFLHDCFDGDLLEQAHKKRSESSWVVEVITNVTFFINKLVDVPIGCGLSLPGFTVNNKGLHCLSRNNRCRPYVDNLCVFRCLALHMGQSLNCLESTTKRLFL